MMMVGAPLGVNFAAIGTIIYSKHLRLTVMWYANSSGGSDASSRKEGRRASWSHVRNGSILSSHLIATTCAVIVVYAAGGEG